MKTISGQINWNFETNGSLRIRDKNGNEIYWESSDGYWEKWEYDSKGNVIYFETSSGFWIKREFDSQGNLTYYENSIGEIKDDRPKPCEDKEIEIDGIKYKLVKQ